MNQLGSKPARSGILRNFPVGGCLCQRHRDCSPPSMNSPIQGTSRADPHFLPPRSREGHSIDSFHQSQGANTRQARFSRALLAAPDLSAHNLGAAPPGFQAIEKVPALQACRNRRSIAVAHRDSDAPGLKSLVPTYRRTALQLLCDWIKWSRRKGLGLLSAPTPQHLPASTGDPG